MKPLLVLNFKNFRESTGSNAVKLAKLCERFARKNKKFQVVVCPSFTDLAVVRSVVSRCWVFSQHVDAFEYGSFTGGFPVPLTKKYCAGTLLNHSEKKLSPRVLKHTVFLCKKYKLKTLVCADSVSEARAVALFSPDFIAIEPPDLIGRGVSVSTAKPELIVDGIEAVKKIGKIPVLVGAGITSAADVFRSLELGADGVLVASAFAKSRNPKKWLSELR